RLCDGAEANSPVGSPHGSRRGVTRQTPLPSSWARGGPGGSVGSARLMTGGPPPCLDFGHLEEENGGGYAETTFWKEVVGCLPSLTTSSPSWRSSRYCSRVACGAIFPAWWSAPSSPLVVAWSARSCAPSSS